MVLCQYYARGCCKFGNNCRFDHPRDLNNPYAPPNIQQNQIQNPQNKYKFYSTNYANNPNQQQQQQQMVNASRSKENEFLQIVSCDLDQWLHSNQWKLSCYSPLISIAPPIPLFEDFSFEEVRHGLYSAKKENKLNEAIQQVRNKENVIVQTMKQMINPNPDTRSYLLKYYDEVQKIIDSNKMNTNNNQSPFQSQPMSATSNQPGFDSTNRSQNLFANIMNKASQNVPASTFSSLSTANSNNNMMSVNNNQVFMPQPQQQQQQQQQVSAFQVFSNNQMAQSPLQTLQTQTKPQTFMQTFPQPQPQLQNLATNNNFNKFAQIMQTNNNNNQNSMFASNNNNNNNNNTFNNNQFTQQQQFQQQQQKQMQSVYYSNQNDLNDEEMQQYNAPEFTLGRIPMHPPAENFIRKF